MNIKYYYKKATSLLFLLMLMSTACTDNQVDPGYYEGDEEVPVVLNLKGLFNEENAPPTYALTDSIDQEGTGVENTVSDITVFIFNANTNACDKIIQGTSSPIGPKLVKSGNKKIIVVANGNGKFVKNPFYVPGEEGLISYNVLRRMITDPVLTALPTDPFLMTGETTVQLQPEKPETAPNNVTIEVKRAVAKVKIFFTKSNQLTTHELKMKSLKLFNGASKVAVLQKDPSDVFTYDVESPLKIGFTPSTRIIPTQSSGGYCMLADTFYTYESLCGRDTTKAVYFEMEVEVNSPANVRKARFYLAQDDATTDTVWNVKRNYWYHVYVNIADPGVDSIYIKVNSSPWNTATPIDTSAGGGFEAKTATPFKLVKNYTAAELSGANGSFAAINSHSKGASYIDLKVSTGTPWTMTLPGGVPENVGAGLSVVSGSNWPWPATVSGTGDDVSRRVFIYRPYVENAEPNKGPLVELHVGGKLVRTFVVQPRDTIPVPTNCYILRPQLVGTPLNETRAYIPLAGVYRYWEDYILANGDAIPSGTVTAVVQWQDRQAAIPSRYVIKTSPLEFKVIDGAKRDSAYLYVEAGPMPGNAIVSVLVGGVVYWSYHIWVTDYNPYENAGQRLHRSPSKNPPNKANVFMDRNLGAVLNVWDVQGEARGLFYQFGRKDPLSGGNKWSINPLRYIPPYDLGTFTLYLPAATTPPTAATVLRPKVAIPNFIRNPLAYYQGTWSFYTEDNRLWNTEGGNKTAFDPCPEGWRVPVCNDAGSNDFPWPESGFTYKFDPDGEHYGEVSFNHDSLGYYPLSGSITDFQTIDIGGNAIVNGWAPFGEWWTTRAVNSQGYGMRMRMVYNTNPDLITYSVTPQLIDFSKGLSVRCVVDVNYLRNKNGGKFVNGSMLKDELLSP
ncbi:MAG: hypothetical protein LBT42_05655 [Tannerella sp.]|jgi:hypothetical protein|nr:hypothetical protein [Tannerella sp.]